MEHRITVLSLGLQARQHKLQIESVLIQVEHQRIAQPVRDREDIARRHQHLPEVGVIERLHVVAMAEDDQGKAPGRGLGAVPLFERGIEDIDGDSARASR